MMQIADNDKIMGHIYEDTLKLKSRKGGLISGYNSLKNNEKLRKI